MTLSPTAPLEEFLRETIGLATDSLGRGLIERVARKRMEAAGCADVEEYVRRLRGDERLRQQLIEDLVVPETWFFRDRQPFVLLTELAAKRQAPLRLLSMPCSTGEEPYSLAMALLDAGLAPDSFCIDAVDISEVSLGVAKAAGYGSNSFRGDQGAARETWFRAEDGRWRLDPLVRSRVTFHHGNLFTFAPSGRYDFIFCRNLLIYFDAPAQGAAVRRLLGLLREDGVLFVGHAEAAVMLREGLGPLPVPRAFAFTRRLAAAPKAEVAPVRRQPATPKPAAPAVLPFADVKPRPAAAPVADAPSLEAIQALADRGRLDEAAGQVQAHLVAHGPGAAAYHLLAIIQDARGDAAAAEAAYRKVLYLNPRHEEAVLHLALLLEKRGDPEAARLRQRVRRPAGRGGDA
ncbi:MAG: methylase of chemotaxis methyl-accepting protein [Rariglobus sp.]|jgi:chemotaxis protein methyltransferase WspC|nr:methylase of chemotaxis methyl-accepting protein [Rariglobus sp.]